MPYPWCWATGERGHIAARRNASVIASSAAGGAALAILARAHLSHRLPDTYDDIVDMLCHALNALTAERIRSLTRERYLEQIKV